MRNEYEMITVSEYINNLETVKVLSVEEQQIEAEIEKYLLSAQRAKTNAKVVEALLA